MECVGAGSRGHVNRAARQPPELGTHVVGLHPELIDCVLRGNQRSQIDVGDIHRRPVDISGVLVRLPAANLIISPGEGIRPRGRGPGLAARNDARHKAHQAINIPSVQRRFEHFPRIDHLAQRRVFRLQQRSLRRDFHQLVDVPHLQGHIDADRALYFDGDRVAGEAPESCLLHFDLVLAGHQVDEVVSPCSAG